MVPSPCVDVCELDAHNLCIGCLRQGHEIMAWPSLSNDGKLEVMARIADRRRTLDHSIQGD